MAEAILSTKLHAPRLPLGWIVLERPAKRLDAGGQVTLALVSAPAGYGKSTCVAGWFESRDEPAAWVSLEPGDSDPGQFGMYLVAAVRTVFPGACAETQELLEALRASWTPSRRLSLWSWMTIRPSASRRFTSCSPSCWLTLRSVFT